MKTSKPHPIPDKPQDKLPNPANPKGSILLCLIITLTTLSAGAGVVPLGSPEYDFLYELYEKNECIRLDRFDYQLGPYRIENTGTRLGPFRALKDLSPRQLTVFGFAGEKFRSVKESSPTGYEFFRGGIVGQVSDRIFVYANFILDEEKAKAPDYTGKKWRGLAGSTENAFASYRSTRFDLTVGRFASFWGPRRSLILGPQVSMDGLGYAFRWGRLTLSYRLARLDGLSPEVDGVAQFENRYFAGHRLDFHLGHCLRIGAFETIIFGGPGRSVDLFYLNPIILFHAAQLNEDTNDNTVLGFDLTCKPVTGLKLYGQVMVDDLQVDDSQQSDQEPDQIGLLAGAFWSDLGDILDARLEYTRVNNWTFNQVFERNRYLYHGDLIGGADGNDYDYLTLHLAHWLGEYRQVSLQVGYRRRGEGSVTAEWTAPWLNTDGDYSESFPTGTVEKTLTVAAGFRSFFLDHFYVDLKGGVDRLNNAGHVEGMSKTLPFIEITVTSFAFVPISLD